MIEEEQANISQYMGLNVPARSRVRRGGSGSFAAGGGDASPFNSAAGEGMKRMAHRRWGAGMDVMGNKSQVANCKEDPCLGPAACDFRHEILRGRASKTGQARILIKALWVTI